MNENLIIRQRWWLYGRPAPIWLHNRDFVQDFVRKNKVKPIEREHLAALDLSPALLPAEAMGADKVPVQKFVPYYGGMRVPHLHLGDQIYRLNQEQWKAFSSGIIENLRTKLDRAGTVSFEQLMELSDVMDALG